MDSYLILLYTATPPPPISFLFVGEELRLPVSSKDYMSKLVEYGIMKLHASATVKETNQTWFEEDDFQVIMPTVDIKVVIRFERSRLVPLVTDTL